MQTKQVLISRPMPEASELGELVRQKGLEPILLPAFQFEPASPGIDFNEFWIGDRTRLAIFSSPRAVEFGLRQLPAGFLDGVQLAAMGPATAGMLEMAGYADLLIPVGGYNSESLLDQPVLNTSPGKALIFSAPGGRQKLFIELRDRGWDVEFAHVYGAIPVTLTDDAIAALKNSHQPVSVWTSANALHQISQSLDDDIWNTICDGSFVVTSERLKEKSAGFKPRRVYVTDGPGNDAIMECILQLI